MASRKPFIINNTQDSLSSSTGSLIVRGGVAIRNSTDAVSSTSGGAMTIAGGAAISKNLFVGGNFSASNSSGSIVLASNGNVGIGLTTPNATLQFSNTLGNRRIVCWQDANNDHQYHGLGVNDSIFRYQVSATSANHVFYSGASSSASNELMRISGSGNVGIGSTNPVSKLDILVSGNLYRSTKSQTSDSNTSGTYSEWTNSNNTARMLVGMDGLGYTGTNYGAGNIGTWSNHPLRISSNSLERMRITSDGNVGINTSVPTYTLDVAGTFEAAVSSGSIVLASNGNVGIGLTNPNVKLHVSGDIFATGDITAFSDSRLKTDIVTIDKPLDKVNALRGVYYTAVQSSKRSVGVIAQEIQQVLPEVVNDSGDYLGVAYGNVVGLLIEAIKELEQKINSCSCKCTCENSCCR